MTTWVRKRGLQRAPRGHCGQEVCQHGRFLTKPNVVNSGIEKECSAYLDGETGRREEWIGGDTDFPDLVTMDSEN